MALHRGQQVRPPRQGEQDRGGGQTEGLLALQPGLPFPEQEQLLVGAAGESQTGSQLGCRLLFRKKKPFTEVDWPLVLETTRTLSVE